MENYIGNIKIKSFESKINHTIMYDLWKKDDHGVLMPVGRFHDNLDSARKEAKEILDEINS